jgi:hypothetical protein
MQLSSAFKSISRIHVICLGSCAAFFLAGCVQGNVLPTTGSSTSVIPPNAGVPSAQAERVIVTFNQSVRFSSSEFMLEMQRLTQARLFFHLRFVPGSGSCRVIGGATDIQMSRQVGQNSPVKECDVNLSFLATFALAVSFFAVAGKNTITKPKE